MTTTTSKKVSPARRFFKSKALTAALLVAYTVLYAPAWSLNLSQAYEAALLEDASIRATRATWAAR